MFFPIVALENNVGKPMRKLMEHHGNL